MNDMRISRWEDEYWYGGCTSWGNRMPIVPGCETTLQLSPNATPNQATAGLVSSKGRWLWVAGDAIRFTHREIVCADGTELGQAGNTLRDAYLSLKTAHFPFRGARPADRLFTAPIFNTWIELTFDQNQEAVLDYAAKILDNGYEPGVLMIDDGWAECYGDWRFHSGRFPNPAAMIDRLHHMGFSVMLWVCPYVTPDSVAYRKAKAAGYLYNPPRQPAMPIQWWNGWSAALDLANPAAVRWMQQQLDELCELGVDGFKLDGGDALHYGSNGNRYAQLWSAFGARYSYNELRASWNAGGLPLLQRLCDKEHSWGDTGIKALIPDTLAQGITGHPFACSDMVGGGEYLNFIDNADRLDAELFVCHAAISCLMPSIQFSAAPWRVLPEREHRQTKTLLALRQRYQPLLNRLRNEAAITGEPLVRYMEYEYPGQGLERITDQFMLGSELLVAPSIHKGATQRRVALPAGHWSAGDITVKGGDTVILPVSAHQPIVLKRMPS